MQIRIEIAQVKRRPRCKYMADADILDMAGLRIEIRIAFHIRIRVVHVICRRRLEHASPRCIDLRIVIRAVVDGDFRRPVRAELAVMIHAQPRHERPFVCEMHGILHIERRRRDFLVLIARNFVR